MLPSQSEKEVHIYSSSLSDGRKVLAEFRQHAGKSRLALDALQPASLGIVHSFTLHKCDSSLIDQLRSLI